MTELPRYKNPPITEVAVSVQFESVADLMIPHVGLIWERFKDRFPHIEQHGLLGSTIERLRPSNIGQPQISLSSNVETPRVWFVSDDGADLVQVQPNRFVRNWRKQPTERRAYPHYDEHIRPSFLEDLNAFRQGLIDIGLSDISVNQCELTYVNHIMPNEVWTSHEQINRVLSIWPDNATDLFGSGFENASIKFSNQITGEKGEFLGRVHFDIQPRFLLQPGKTGEPEPVFVCNIVARGQPLTDGDDGFVQFLDLGRRQIVELFEKMFTEELQLAWQKSGEA